MGISKHRNTQQDTAFSQPQPEEEAIEDSNETIVLEPVHPESYDLSYTCLLIPRLPAHQLKADLAQRLPPWLKQICGSFNWNLEFVTVNPGYLQWGLRVVPAVQTGQFIQEIRHRTSQLILATFDHLHNETPNGDFWAPGYLVVLGTRPHPKEMIEQYIRLSRRQHGPHSA